MTKPQVTFIGLGAMGLHMANMIRAAGYNVRGYDVRSEVVKSFHQDDASKCSKSVSEAAKGADILILMVISHIQAHSILFTAEGGGALNELAQGADILLMATCSQEASHQLARQVADKRPDVGFVDAPVSGGAEGAKSGGLTIMAAAKVEVFQRVKPVLEIMGSKLYHVGTEIGQGSAMKAVNQVSLPSFDISCKDTAENINKTKKVLCGIHLVAAAEALSLASKSGIDPALALSIVQNSAASSWMLQQRAPRMLEKNDPEVKSAVNLFLKDLDIVTQTGKQVGAVLPLSAAALQMFVSSSARGDGAKDDSRIIKTYQALNGQE